MSIETPRLKHIPTMPAEKMAPNRGIIAELLRNQASHLGLLFPVTTLEERTMKISVLVGAVALLAFTSGVSLAAPCMTDSSKDGSASVEPGSKNLAGGQQPASAGTVGAMNNVGSDQGLGQKQVANTVTEKGKGSEDPASKNTAGGQQPASPGTVGAMNNTGSDQALGKKGDDC